MEKIIARLQIIFIVIAIAAVCLNIYTGAALRKIGIPGIFELEFDPPGTQGPPPPNRPTPTSLHNTPTPVKRIEPPRVASHSEAYIALEAQTPLLEDLASELYDVNSRPGQTYTYNIDLNGSQDIMWVYGWCTTTQELLMQNWGYIGLVFTLDGGEIPLNSFVRLEAKNDELICRYYYTLLTDWPRGEHLLTTEITFTTSINDGLESYPAGVHIYEYHVHVNG